MTAHGSEHWSHQWKDSEWVFVQKKGSSLSCHWLQKCNTMDFHVSTMKQQMIIKKQIQEQSGFHVVSAHSQEEAQTELANEIPVTH